MWDPRIGKRNVGLQRIRWADYHKKIAGVQWTTRARDRHVWRDLEKFSVNNVCKWWINMCIKKKNSTHIG
jgi:hypothetical protein